ncbi:hypothetical protein NIES4103_31440 [Nostoc sp. NIES-4103]|nr:hypothetical protein NIES4103_31440 [Nostoc sp. NIES-4103]
MENPETQCLRLIYPLSKREILAGMALAGLLANPNNGSPELQAPRAIKAADALIASLDDSTQKK